MSAERYDLVVIGAGPGGYVAAIRGAQLGLRAAVVERDRPGGVCLNWGCIPSKAILTAADLYSAITTASRWGIRTGETSVDYEEVINRSREAADRLCRGVESLLKKHKIPLIAGSGRLEHGGTVVVEGGRSGAQRLAAERVIVATGSAERTLPGLEVDGRQVLTSREALEDRALPASIVIIGGGAVGVEFAHSYHAFGTRVTIVEMEAQLLPGMDAEVGVELGRAFARRGIEVLTSTRFEALRRTPSACEVAVARGNGSQTLRAEKVLVAVGRSPLSAGLGLEELGVEFDRGFIKVDGGLRTACDWIYAIGDVNGPPLLAHAASAEGIAAVEMMAGRRERGVDRRTIPTCVYCQPEVAAIGLTEAEALAAGLEVKVGRIPFRANGKAVAAGYADGFVKLVADKRYGEILGCHIVGHGATELIAEIGIARTLEATTREVGGTVHAHPTLSEAIMEAALAADGESINF